MLRYAWQRVVVEMWRHVLAALSEEGLDVTLFKC